MVNCVFNSIMYWSPVYTSVFCVKIADRLIFVSFNKTFIIIIDKTESVAGPTVKMITHCMTSVSTEIWIGSRSDFACFPAIYFSQIC